MQIKIITVPILGNEQFLEELNVFLRSKKILKLDKKLVENEQGAFWTFCITYLDDLVATEKEQQKIDYRKVLEEEAFKKFVVFREIRKRIATSENVPSYVVFTDAELAGMAKLDSLTLETMKTIKGIGDKKIEKYGKLFMSAETSEKSEGFNQGSG